MKKIDELKAILADEKKLLGVIKDEIALIRDKYGDEEEHRLDLMLMIFPWKI